MNADALETLINRHLDGIATDQEVSELSQLLETDSQARTLYLRLAHLHATMASELVLDAMPATPTPPPVRLRPRGGFWHWFGFRPLAFGQITVALLMGIFSASVVWSYALPLASRVEKKRLPVANASFENAATPLPDGIPAQPGFWSGDFTRVTEAENGITPKDGKRMLRFLRPDNTRSAPGTRQRSSEQWQIVDLRPMRAQLESGLWQVELSAWFNRIPQPTDPHLGFNIVLCTFQGDPAQAADLWPERRDLALSNSEKAMRVGNGPASWQRLSAQTVLPTEADFLLIMISASTPVLHPTTDSFEFPPCYADAVQLRISPLPAIQ